MAGLEPGGENGGWTQTVPMIRTKLQSPMNFAVKQGATSAALRFPDDIYLSTVRDTTAARIANAPIVFVGFGVNAPERNWDDFKGVDLHGKVALMLVNDPDFEAAPGDPVAGKFGGQTMTYYGRWTYKYEEAARRGAIGALDRPRDRGRRLRLERGAERVGRELQYRPPRRRTAAGAAAGLDPAARGEALLKRAGYDYETLKRQARSAAFKPIDLHATFSADAPVELSGSPAAM